MDDTKKMQNNNLYRIKPIFIMLFSLLCFKELKRNIQKKCCAGDFYVALIN